MAKKAAGKTGVKKVDEILERRALADKIDTARARFEAAVEELDAATELLADPDVKEALEKVRAKWQTRDHGGHAEAAASRLSSIAEDLRAARLEVLGEKEAAKTPERTP